MKGGNSGGSITGVPVHLSFYPNPVKTDADTKGQLEVFEASYARTAYLTYENSQFLASPQPTLTIPANTTYVEFKLTTTDPGWVNVTVTIGTTSTSEVLAIRQ